MGKDTWGISAQRLRQWKKELDREISVADDGIDVVKREIAYILDQMGSSEEFSEVTNLNDLSIDEVYRYESQINKTWLSGALVRVVFKNGRRITVQLMEAKGNYPVNYRVDINFEGLPAGTFKKVSR